MDNKITLSFDESVIASAKKYAAENNISLSRLTEILLRKLTSSGYENFEDFPVSDWVWKVAEGPVEYKRPDKRTRKQAKEEYLNSRK